MARKKTVPDILPKLGRFVLLGLNADNQLSGSGVGRIDLKRTEEIILETIAPGEGTDYCRVVVRLNITVSGRREKDEQDIVRVDGVYEGRFSVQPGITIEMLDSIAGQEAFQYGLTAQIYPLAMSHLRDQLLLMGLTTRHMPIGL